MAIAAATAALTVAAGSPLIVSADAPAPQAVTVAKASKDNCAVELIAGKPAYKAGEKPELMLKLINNASESAEIEATILIEGIGVASPLSRIAIAAPSTLWKHFGKWSVPAGETKEFTLPVDLATPQNQSLRFRLLLGPPSVERAVLSALEPASSRPQGNQPAGTAGSANNAPQQAQRVSAGTTRTP